MKTTNRSCLCEVPLATSNIVSNILNELQQRFARGGCKIQIIEAFTLSLQL